MNHRRVKCLHLPTRLSFRKPPSLKPSDSKTGGVYPLHAVDKAYDFSIDVTCAINSLVVCMCNCH